MYTKRSIFACFIILLSVLGASACDDSITVEDVPGHVAFVGPHEARESAVVTYFGVNDPEGDLLAVAVEVCPDGGACYVPELLPGSASIDTLPAQDYERTSALPLIWAPDCAVLTTSTPFRVRVEVLGSDLEGLESPTTTLQEVGVACP